MILIENFHDGDYQIWPKGFETMQQAKECIKKDVFPNLIDPYKKANPNENYDELIYEDENSLELFDEFLITINKVAIDTHNV